MRTTRVLSLFVLFSTIPFYSSASDLPVQAPSGRSWEMIASDGGANNSLGYLVAISGNTVAVGALGANKVYVYEKPAAGWSNMVQIAELTSSKGGPFGPPVAVSGDTIVVSSGLNTPTGEVYVFVKPSGGWMNMTETAILSDNVSGDYFGVAVAIDGDTIVVGASGTYDDQGAAYVFVKPSSGWATTSAFNAMLTASDGGLLDFLGLSVAISGNTVVAGQPFHNDQTGPGVVYVFVKPAAGWATMTQTAELTQSVRGPYDQFGFAVAVSGNTVVAGAPQADSDAGVAYVFVEPPTGWADMTETADLTTNPGGRFGWTLGISGKQIVVGYDGSASTIPVYAEPESGWQSTSTPSLLLRAGQTDGGFGFSTAISNGVVVAGAPSQTVRGNSDEGTVFGFQLARP